MCRCLLTSANSEIEILQYAYCHYPSHYALSQCTAFSYNISSHPKIAGAPIGTQISSDFAFTFTSSFIDYRVSRPATRGLLLLSLVCTCMCFHLLSILYRNQLHESALILPETRNRIGSGCDTRTGMCYSSQRAPRCRFKSSGHNVSLPKRKWRLRISTVLPSSIQALTSCRELALSNCQSSPLSSRVCLRIPRSECLFIAGTNLAPAF